MKSGWILIVIVCIGAPVWAQVDTSVLSAEQWERLAELELVAEEEDQAGPAELEYFRKHRIPLNRASEADLQALNILSVEQLQQFLRYRELAGKLISIYELQAIPGWDIATIRQLLPYVKLDGEWDMEDTWRSRVREGQHMALLRFGRSLRPRRYLDTGGIYAGNNDRVLLRYSYQYKQLFSWGWAAEKDAGEALWGSRKGRGFDFYSFQVALSGIGKLKTLVIGDYTVNLGQGLLQWQSLAFRKGGSIASVKRQGPVVKPYRSTGEFNFYRGVAMRFVHRRQELFLFVSSRKLDATVQEDSLRMKGLFASTLLTSGQHRTAIERERKGNLGLVSWGGQWRYRFLRGHIAVNAVQQRFSLPLLRADEPYNYYAARGRQFLNYSIDYSYTWRNLHFFGEWAGPKALLGGVLFSAHNRMEAALLFRKIAASYVSFFSNAFIENSTVTNETGVYATLGLTLAKSLRLEAYTDLYRFPWLRYRADLPGEGIDQQIQLIYTPTRKINLKIRYRVESKPSNLPDTEVFFHILKNDIRKNLRLQLHFEPVKTWWLRGRAEWVGIGYEGGEKAEEGFLLAGDWGIHPEDKGFSMIIRGLYFDTGGYRSRIYAFENDVQYSFSTAPYYGKGLRWCINFTGDPSVWTGVQLLKGLKIGLKIAQTVEYLNFVYNGAFSQIVDTKPIDAKVQIQMQF